MMSRLTRKETNYLAGNGYRKCDYLLDGTPKVEALNKLGTLEDLEEELGISMLILFKAILGNGIYVKTKIDEFNICAFYCNDGYKYEVNIKAKRIEIGFIVDEESYYEYYDFKDYGKTWSLSRNDLAEKDNEIYGHTVSYWRRLYEIEFGRDTSKESDKEFLENHKTWIKNNRDESRHC